MNKLFFVRVLLPGIFALTCFFVNAQDVQMSKIIPRSPTAASLGVFGDIPISYYTGTPDISIPLYEIKSGQLSLPVTLSYIATGLRVSQDASWVGLGWSLSAGGLITRVIRGKDDFKGYFIDEKLPPSNDNNEWYLTDYYNPGYVDSATQHDGQYFSDMKQGIIDGEPDIFSFNFGTYSGKFIIDKKVNEAKIFGAQRNNLDITFTTDGNSFTIKTADGTTYLFNTTEYVISAYNTNIDDPSTVVALNGLNKGGASDKSSWYLDKIISPNGDIIELSYKYGESLSLARKNKKALRQYRLIME